MARIFSLNTFLVAAFVSLASPIHAVQPDCSSQLYKGAPPSIKSQKLAPQTHPICFSEIAVLYSGLARTPLWSAERLTARRIELARTLPRLRSNAFHEELSLPEQDRAELADYRRSGFDRGHMAPNGDMSTPESQEESFSLANMIPQDPCNNEVLWEGIESAVRNLVLAENEVFVVTGPAFLGAELQSLKGRVLVPTHIYKAVFVPSRHAAAAYFAPNDGSQDFDAISLSDLETKVGIDVFPQLDDTVKRNAMTLPAPTPHFGCRLRTSEAGSQARTGR
jgi:endonuclease G, mitochondrial